MAGWEYEYVGPKKRRKVSPQMRALRKRHLSGLKMAKPDDTRSRVDLVIAMMENGKWVRGRSIDELASKWNLSRSRVEQIAAEASRRFNNAQ